MSQLSNTAADLAEPTGKAKDVVHSVKQLGS